MRDEADSILGIGVSLQESGINNWALNAAQISTILPKLVLNRIAVYGGDILVKEDGNYRHTYDNWYSEKANDESWDAFVIRSAEETTAAVNYYSGLYESPFFTLVVQGESSP